MFRPGVNGYHNAVGWDVFLSQIRKAERLLSLADDRRRYSSVDDIRKAGKAAKEFFLEAIGGIPCDDSELDARVVGEIKRERYTIRKVVYQSLDKFYVTSNLYVPNKLDGRAPAILLCMGHARAGKGYENYRSAADLLVRNGFIVFAFDPPGQGERLNLIDRRSGVQKVRWGTREHSWLGLLSVLSGGCIARYFIRDAQRGIDYLSSLPEVDMSRIGVTGISGGGTQSSYLALVEERISAAAPGCYVTERLEYMKKFHAHDGEQNIFGHIPAGFNYCDYFINFAPKPLLLQGVAYDFFPIEGLLKTYEIVRSVYSQLGVEERCRIFVDDTVHGFSRSLRKETLRFFSEFFTGKSDSELDFSESPVEAEELLCTKSKQVLMEYPEAVGLDCKICEELPKDSERKLCGDELREHIRSIVFSGGRKIGRIYPRIISKEETGCDYQLEKIFFYSESDIALTAEMIKPIRDEHALRGGVIALLKEGTNTLAWPDKMSELFENVGGADKNIFVVDVRGLGGARIGDGLADEMSYRNMYGTLFKIAYNYWMLGDNFVACRVFDVLCALRYLRSRADVDEGDVMIYAEDDLAFVGLLSAVADGKINKVVLKNLPESYYKEASKVYYNREVFNEWTVIHGMLKDFDVPQLCGLLKECVII